MASSASGCKVPTFKTVIVDVDDAGVLTVTLNRPQAKNAFNDQLYLDLSAALLFGDKSDDVAAMIITGSGSFFSSGADVSGASALPDEFNSAEAPVGQFMLTLMAITKPVIAAVNGPAIGIGTTMIAHCDVSYAVENAYFWTPFTRIAVVPEFCSSVLFSQIMGPSKANEMLLMARKMMARDAAACGLISEVLPKQRLMSEVRRRVHEMLDYPLARKSLPLFKRMCRQARAAELRAVCRAELAELDKRLENGDSVQAAMVMMQKRYEAKERRAQLQSKL